MNIKSMMVLFAFLWVPISLKAEINSDASDSSIGKSPLIVFAPAGLGVNGMSAQDVFQADSAIGKLPVLSVTDGPPPRSKGPGLHFDSKKRFYVYSDRRGPQNHFTPSGWMGDFRDIEVNDASQEDPADGSTCFKVTYRPRWSEGFGWAGIYWQDPVNNWGMKQGGFNLSGMKRLTFWARGAKGDEEIAAFSAGGITGLYHDSGVAHLGPVSLTKDWKQYSIDLSSIDLSHVIGGFAWAASATENPGGMTFYIDEIRYER